MIIGMTACVEEKGIEHRFIGIAEKVIVINTEDLDTSGRRINVYDVYINGSPIRILTGCYAGQKVYRDTQEVRVRGDYKASELISCIGPASFMLDIKSLDER